MDDSTEKHSPTEGSATFVSPQELTEIGLNSLSMCYSDKRSSIESSTVEAEVKILSDCYEEVASALSRKIPDMEIRIEGSKELPELGAGATVAQIDMAWAFLPGAVSDQRSAKKAQRDEKMRQARLSFNAALFLLSIGILIIFVGCMEVFFQVGVSASVVSIVASIILDAISGALFLFNRDINKQLEDLNKDIDTLVMVGTALQIICQINHVDEKDKALLGLVGTLKRS